MKLISSLEDVRSWIDGGFAEPATVMALDLTSLDQRFANARLAGSAFLGCAVGETLLREIHRQRAALMTDLPGLPPRLRAFATSPYTVGDLYAGLREDGDGWDTTPDFDGFQFFIDIDKKVPKPLSFVESVAARLHDTAQERALSDLLRERDVVAIMGGHDFKRRLTDEEVAAKKPDVYWNCVSIAKALTEAEFLVVTGGGPGLMEAGNLGALLAGAKPETVASVRELLTNQPFNSKEWRSTAMSARKRILGSWDAQPDPAQYSLGIPTWFYGHEPPNFFASHHSKMFFNSLREDGLVTLANKGIIFFEGNAGTVQEVFQDVAQNYYRHPRESATPMVFYNTDGYWDRSCGELTSPTEMSRDKRKPLLPLLKQLAAEKRFTDAVLVTTSAADTVEFLKRGKSDRRLRKADTRLANPIASATAMEGVRP
jgi:predicted Rossmann-fold nucleotide-binding protein